LTSRVFAWKTAIVLAQGELFRQAIAQFTRVRQLAPDNPEARLWLAQLYNLARLPDRALEAIQDVRGQPEKFSLTTRTKSRSFSLRPPLISKRRSCARHATARNRISAVPQTTHCSPPPPNFIWPTPLHQRACCH